MIICYFFDTYFSSPTPSPPKKYMYKYNLNFYISRHTLLPHLNKYGLIVGLFQNKNKVIIKL